MTSVKTPLTLKLNASHSQSGPVSEKESAARVALEALSGRCLSDPEWARARTRLLDFVSILRAWHRKGTTIASDLPKAA